MAEPTVEETIAFIKQAHEGQIDKSGLEYWLHPVNVMINLGEHASEQEKLVALLHDVLEDTPYERDDLIARGYSENTIAAVELLSRPGDWSGTYMDWIKFIAASGNKTAIRVKIADCEHNSHPDRISKLPENEQSIRSRYLRALKILRDVEANNG